MAEQERTGEALVVHMDINLYIEIWSRAFALVPQLFRSHDDRLAAADDIVSLVRRYAPVIMAAAQSQARAETVIGAALGALTPDELDALITRARVTVRPIVDREAAAEMVGPDILDGPR